MRIYQNIPEMIKEIERDLYEMGITYESETVQDKKVSGAEAQTLELFGYSYALDPAPRAAMVNFYESFQHLGCSPEHQSWVVVEAIERVDHKACLGFKNPGVAWEADGAFWSKFIRDGVFSYSYAERWQAQLPYIIEELRRRPNTRQAIITMYDWHQDIMNFGGRDRVPCSLTYQFILRGDRLSVIYNQRSCDFLKFFLADVYFTCALLDYVATRVGAKTHKMIHFLGSLHAFKADLESRGIF